MKKIYEAVNNAFKGGENGEYVFFIDKKFPAFEGHFPGMPLLPGIVQIEIALYCIKKYLNKEAVISEIRKVKFVKPIPPEAEIFVHLSENNGSLSVAIKDKNETYSQMQLKTETR